MSQENFFMKQAFKQAKLALEKEEVPVGAILVKNDEIIGTGFNQSVSLNDPSAHAEIIALREASKKLKNYRLTHTTMYVTLEPCTMCVGALIHSRVEKIVFAATDPKSGVVVSNSNLLDKKFFNHKIKYSHGLYAKKSSNLLQEFFLKRRV